MFVIDKEGILRHITINDLPIGRSVDEALRIIEALQFTEQHGEGKIIISSYFWTYLISGKMSALKMAVIRYRYDTQSYNFSVCPANWKKGDKTIKPDPKGSQEYFKSTHS